LQVVIGPVKGNRQPTTAIPGSKGSSRPVAQKGGGGNKAAGSVEPTAATSPTVTVHSDGSVTAEHFSPSKAGEAAQVAAVARQRASEARTKRVVALVTSKPERKPVVAKGTTPKAPKLSTKPQIETRPAISAPPKEAKALAQAIGIGPKTPGGKETKAPRTVTVAAHTRKAPESRLKGTQQERKAARKTLQKAKKVVARTSGVGGRVKQTGQLEPQEIATALVKQGRKLNLNLTRPEVAEGVGVAEAETAGNASEQRQLQELPPDQAHVGLFAEEEGSFAPLQKRLETGPATRAALKRFAADGRSWNPAWVHWQEIQGEDETGHDRAPQYEGVAAKALEGQSNPKAFKNYKTAVKKAKSLGMKVGKPAGDVSAEPGTHTIRVRADAQGMVKWAESVQGTKESTPRQLRWAANEGLGFLHPWCANFVSNGLLRRGIKSLPSNPNYVPSYESDWHGYSIGTTDLSKAKPGDLITFSGEHIGLYVGNGEMISGNFGDEVSRDPVSADSTAVSMILRPPYKGGYVKVTETTPLPGSLNPTGSVASSSAPAAVGAVAAPSNPAKKKGQPKVRLSAPQRIANAERTLKAGDLKAGKEAEAPSTSVLAELQRKYGAAA